MSIFSLCWETRQAGTDYKESLVIGINTPNITEDKFKADFESALKNIDESQLPTRDEYIKNTFSRFFGNPENSQLTTDELETELKKHYSDKELESNYRQDFINLKYAHALKKMFTDYGYFLIDIDNVRGELVTGISAGSSDSIYRPTGNPRSFEVIRHLRGL